MSELSGQCELCLNQSNQISIRVFPCLYHCKKMLCIQHLSEHDKYIEKQIQFKNEIEKLWKNYNSIFNEEKIQQEYEKLKNKLENYQNLKKLINQLLSINHFGDSIENDQKFQMTIRLIQKAIEKENQSNLTTNKSDYVHPKIESILNNNQEESTIDNSPISSSIITNDESETVDSLPSLLNPNENSFPDDEDLQPMDESDDHGNSIEDDDSIKDETNVTPNRSIIPSKIRDYCPLTHDGAFGIISHIHGVPLCSSENPRTYRLHHHFRRVHHLTSLASLALCRTIGSGHDPMTTRLFSNHHVILNIDELRTVTCPINKPFIHYPTLEIDHFPCHILKQVRHLKDHLKRIHKFSNKAANMIIKLVQDDRSIHMIQFPQWINIIENDN